jgi:hypothetical protein
MASKKPALFAREATGLVREIGFTLGVIIILSHVIGLGWQKRAFQFTGPTPMPTDWMPLGLPAIFWAFSNLWHNRVNHRIRGWICFCGDATFRRGLCNNFQGNPSIR